jgi:poly(A) polymerase
MRILEIKLEINGTGYLSIARHIKSAGGQVRLIGGVVRDALLERSSSDIDIATDLLPEEVIEVLKKHHIKVIPTGIKFGTVTAFFNEEAFEITTLRKDLSSDGRRAHVEFTNDFYIDAERRDFTINALSYCPFEHKVYDYFTGLEDLKKHKVVFIGKAEDRIKEDYLRILRFFRFSGRFASSVDETGLTACESLRFGLRNLSKERVKTEMDRLLQDKKSPAILQLMFDKKILGEILPIMQFDKAVIESAGASAGKIDTRLEISSIYALLFKDIKGLDKDFLLDLKFSGKEAGIIVAMIRFGKILAEDDLLIELKRLWWEDKNFAQYYVLAMVFGRESQKILELYASLQNRERAPFPVSGTDVIKKTGYSGRKTGEIIKRLKRAWIKADFSLNKKDLIELIDDYTK